MNADAAVEYALKQVGKPYIYGATGPAGFDCSGLITAAWRHGGLHMPHNSAQQANELLNPSVNVVKPYLYNTRKLRPGDLIFYYPGITHVAMFVRREGRRNIIVQATNERYGVQTIRMKLYAKPVAYGFVKHK